MGPHSHCAQWWNIFGSVSLWNKTRHCFVSPWPWSHSPSPFLPTHFNSLSFLHFPITLSLSLSIFNFFFFFFFTIFPVIVTLSQSLFCCGGASGVLCRSTHNLKLLLVCSFSLKMFSFFLIPYSHLIFSTISFCALFISFSSFYSWVFCMYAKPLLYLKGFIKLYHHITRMFALFPNLFFVLSVSKWGSPYCKWDSFAFSA